MKLLAIRNLNEQDPIGPLGPAATPNPTPPPAGRPHPSNSDIWIGPDGKWETRLPEQPSVPASMTLAEALEWVIRVYIKP